MGEEQPVQRIGDHEVLAVLGAGGMGKVYKVRNVFTDRIEAMKIVLPDLAGQQEVADRFLREIKVLARLSHPNIAALLSAQMVENQLVMLMEFVEGSSLASRVAQGPIPPAEAIGYIDQVLAALGYAHEHHIVHRDIKPANMMLTPDGVVKLMDFGIARSSEDRALTMAGTSLGSLPYMSPEQITGEDIDARADLYAVGVSLYEMVTGAKPFQADSNYAMMVAHLQNVPRPPIELQPGLPAALNQVILMALAKNRDERFQSAAAFRAALKNVSESLGGGVGAAVLAPPIAVGAAAATASLKQSSIPGSVAAGPAATPVQTPAPPAAPQSAKPAFGTSVGHPSPAEATPVANRAWSPADSVLPPPGVAKPGSYRGLYMTLGALVVIAVLVVAGLYGPRWARTRAGGNAAGDSRQNSQPTSNVTPPSSPADASASSSQTPTAGAPATGSEAGKPANDISVGQPQPSNPPLTSTAASIPNSQSSGPPQAQPKNYAAHAGGGSRPANSGFSSASAGSAGQQPRLLQSSSQPGGDASAQPQVSEGSTAAELEDLENQMDQLTTRATAARESVETLRRQQQAQGFNLRGDISAAADLMATNIDRAKAALQNRNAKDARRYMDKAETSLGTLEKFLGRR